jgi:sterol desaturase/sphingolipid hydroxylase (fatty acid hydroxylase superfamily)
MAIRDQSKQRANRQWHYMPDVPVQVSPLFRKPFNLVAVAKWFIGAWFPVSERLLILVLSIASWVFFHPSLEQCREFELGWMAQILIRNLALIFVVAGSLHLYLYVFQAQQNERRYDVRPFGKNKRSFSFNNQVLDNMFWTCASGVTIWSGYEIVMMWGMANGYVPQLSGPRTFIWLTLLIFLVPVWETFYFYLIHRLLHWPPLYRHVHSLHHRNTNVGPWAGLSMHPIEHLIYLGSVLIHLIIPANPLLLIYHLQYFTLSAVTTHSGYEGLDLGGRNLLSLGTFHHQMHHRYFECNYGGLEVPWDKWFGSFHDGTEASHEQFQEKQRLRAKRAYG